jgi:hypothetical protein
MPGEDLVNWVMLCESVAWDATGQLSLIGIAAHLTLPLLCRFLGLW